MINSQLYITFRISIVLILIQSCVLRNQDIIRDDAGNIILKCELKNGVRHGKCYEYYPDGTVNVVSNWFSGILEGEKTYYYKTGKIQSTGMYQAGERYGEFVWYYETGEIETKMLFVNGRGMDRVEFDEAGNLKDIRKFIHFTGEPQLNTKLVFNTDSAHIFPNNVIIEESFWSQIQADKDTIDLGDFAEYEMGWVSKDYLFAYVGNFDHKFNLIDGGLAEDVDLDNKNRFYPAHSGTDTLRVIVEFCKIENGEYVVLHQTFLEKVFTVIEK